MRSRTVLYLTHHCTIVFTYLKCLCILLEATQISSTLDLLAVGVRYHRLDGAHLEFRRDGRCEKV
jgi:hypothetical protein